jgi:hypothetical protein
VKIYYSLLCFLAGIIATSAQVTIKGKIIDASTGEGMPFVNIAFKGTTIGTTTDFDGFYKLVTVKPGDSLTVSYVGYKTVTKAIQKGVTLQTIDFQLESTETKLDEVKFIFKEDPAYPIMRKVIANKPKNEKRALEAYQYESYVKIEFDVDNISEDFKQRKFVKKITAVMDSIQKIAGENGKAILPVFISESVSDFYYLRKPEKQKEIVQKTKISGLGVTDGTLVSQFIGSSFQQYDFYENWMSILEKDFVSPLADSWKSYYDYYLMDSLYLGEHWCYKIDVEPQRKQDLAFSGTIWVDSKTFALKQVDVTCGKGANINFVDKIKIQQELESTEAGPWIPVKTRVLVDVIQLTKKAAGMLAKFYTSNKNIKVNKPKDLKFYDTPLETDEEVRVSDNNYWETHRHDTLTTTEKNVYKMIDSVKNIPTIKSYIEIANIAFNGYKTIGKVDLGPYALLYANNNIEGIRPRVGFKTNIHFSRKLILRGYLAYGTLDTKLKYDAQAHYILKRKPWTMIGYKYRHELEQVGRLTEDLYDNTLFLASIRFGTLRRAFMRDDHQFYIQTDVMKGVRQTFKARHFNFNPVPETFTFGFYENTGGDNHGSVAKTFETTEITGETRISSNETFIINDNERISLGTKKLPTLTFTYTVGIKGALGSDFTYLKLGFNASQYLQMGTLGRAYYSFNVGYTPSQLPYPLLYVHRGNQTNFYNSSTFNLMNYFEFVSDTYASLHYEHYFEGLFFNRIPLIKKLKWRFVATSDILWGSLRQQNIDIIPQEIRDEQNGGFQWLGNDPYIEIGYGIENIFKFIRLDFMYRLTYPHHTPDTRVFGLKFSTQFKL